MPEYLYRNDAGDTISVFESVNDKHHEVRRLHEGALVPANHTDEGPDIYRRVFGVGLQLNANLVKDRYGPSYSLPLRVPGEEWDKEGRTIVKDADHQKRLCERLGYTKSEDATVDGSDTDE